MSTLAITKITERGAVRIRGMNTPYGEIEAAVNAVDRDNIAAHYTITEVATHWEELTVTTNPQTHKVVVPTFALDARSYLLGFAYEVEFFAAIYDCRLTLKRGDTTYGDRDTIEQMAVYSPGHDWARGTRDTLTEAFRSGDYVSISLEEVSMSVPGGGTPPANFSGTGPIAATVRLYFAHPILSGTEL